MKKPVAPPDDRVVRPLDAETVARAKKLPHGFERLKIHRALLIESMRRLRAGRHLEREHGVIHPELTAITRDVLRLTDLVFPLTDPAPEPVKVNAGDQAFRAAVDADGAEVVAELLEIDRSTVEKWAAESVPEGARKHVADVIGFRGKWET